MSRVNVFFLTNDRKLSFKQIAVVDFCVKLGKSSTPTNQMVHASSVSKFISGLSDFEVVVGTLEDDEKSDRKKTGMVEVNIQTMRNYCIID